MTDNVVVVEPGDERAQKIAKAMGSQTASDILQLLGESPKSLTDITDRLAIPMTTAKYHMENLLDAGLISVAETKYSVKGREVKIYSLTNQLLIVAPRQSNIRSLLLKYTSLFGIVAFGSLVIAIMSPVFGHGITGRISPNAPPVVSPECGSVLAKAVNEGFALNTTTNPDMMVAGSKGISDAAANMTPAPHPLVTLVQLPPDAGVSIINGLPDTVLAFFLGGVLVILVLLVYEVWLWKNR